MVNRCHDPALATTGRAFQTGTPAPKRTPVCRRDPANRPRCLQKQESAETGTPVGNAPLRDAVAINCAATGRGTRLRGCPAEVSAQADTVNCRCRIYSDGETAAIFVVLSVTGQAAPLVSASAPRREVRAGGHLDCLRRSTRIAYNLRVLSKVLKAGRASCQKIQPERPLEAIRPAKPPCRLF